MSGEDAEASHPNFVATYINVVVTVTLAESAVLIVLAIAITIDLQITKFGSSLGSWHGGGLGSDIGISISGIGRSVIIEFIDIQSTLSAAWAGTGISQTHLITCVLAVGLGGIGVDPVIVPITDIVPPATVDGAELVKTVISETIDAVVKHVLIRNVRAGNAWGSRIDRRWLVGCGRFVSNSLASVFDKYLGYVRTAVLEIGICDSGLEAGILAVGLGRVWVAGVIVYG